MLDLVQHRLTIILIFLLLFFSAVTLFFVLRVQQQEVASPLENEQLLRDLARADETFISPPEDNGSGDKFVTLQGELLSTEKGQNENIIKIKVTSLQESPVLSIDLGGSQMKIPYVVSELINPESLESAELIENHELISVDQAMTNLSTELNKTVKVQLLTSTEKSVNDCPNQDCVDFLSEFQEYQSVNQILVDSAESVGDKKFGAVFELWEPYE